MALLRSQPLRLLLIAATLAAFAVPWVLDPHRVAVGWYGFEFTTTPAGEASAPHPGDLAPIALFRAFATVTAGIVLACLLAITRKAWRPGVDLVATLAITGLAVGITLSAVTDGAPPIRLTALGAAAMLLALWSFAAPLLGRTSGDEHEDADDDDEESDEEADDEEEED